MLDDIHASPAQPLGALSRQYKISVRLKVLYPIQHTHQPSFFSTMHHPQQHGHKHCDRFPISTMFLFPTSVRLHYSFLEMEEEAAVCSGSATGCEMCAPSSVDPGAGDSAAGAGADAVEAIGFLCIYDSMDPFFFTFLIFSNFICVALQIFDP